MRSLAVVLALTMVAAGCGEDGDAAPAPGDPVDISAALDVAGSVPDAGTPTTGDAAPVAAEACDFDQVETVTPGMLTIVTGEMVDAPWLIDNDPATAQGFDGAAAYAIAQGLGFDAAAVQWVRGDLGAGVVPDVEFDIGIHHLSRSAAMGDAFDTSVPYAYMPRVLVTEPTSPASQATTLLDLLDVWLGATTGSAEQEYIEDVIGSQALVAYDSPEETFAAVSSGEVEGTIASLPVARQLIESAHPDLAIVSSFPADEQDGDSLVLAIPTGSSVGPCVNTVVQGLHADGTIESLIDAWIQSPPVPEIITESLKTEYVLESPDSIDYAYFIPAGTGDRIDNGEVIEIMPNELDVVVGEVIEIVNEDDQGYIVGPFYVGPQETMRQKFLSAGEFTGRCAVSSSGDIVLRVAEA